MYHVCTERSIICAQIEVTRVMLGIIVYIYVCLYTYSPPYLMSEFIFNGVPGDCGSLFLVVPGIEVSPSN